MCLSRRIIRGLHDDGTRSGSVRTAFRQARQGVVNNLVLKNSLRLGFGGEISEPGAQVVVNGCFTSISKSFIIFEQLQENRPRVASPLTAVFLCSIVGGIPSSFLNVIKIVQREARTALPHLDNVQRQTNRLVKPFAI